MLDSCSVCVRRSSPLIVIPTSRHYGHSMRLYYKIVRDRRLARKQRPPGLGGLSVSGTEIRNVR